MRKKSIYVWSLLVAMLTMTACSSDLKEDVDYSAREKGTFELVIDFGAVNAGAGDVVTRASTAKPATDWSNIKNLQFFLYDPSAVTKSVVWSEIETPTSGTTSGTKRIYTYATIPEGNYTLVVVANTQSNSDAVTTYISNAAKLWTVADVYNWEITALDIRHKTGGWGAAITGSAAATSAVSALTSYAQPSEVFMGYKTGVVIDKANPATATIDLTREVSLLRTRIDQTTHASVVGNVDFTNANASVMLYNLPTKMGIQEGNTGGIVDDAIASNVLVVEGGYSTTASGYLEAPYTSWKDAIVFPNNGGRANNSNTSAVANKKYFIVVCGIAKAGHKYAGGTAANVGDPVFWYGQIDEVFTPNVIREVNVLLKTGGSPTPPPGIVEYGGLEITVNEPKPWGPIVSSGPIEM